MASLKLERLMNLVAALLQTSVPLSAAVIRERVGGYSDDPSAFHRQFSRDKADLREMGIVIRVESVPDSSPPVEGYRVDPSEYYLDDPGLDADELAVLHLATRLITVGEPTASRQGLFKLGGSETPDPAARPVAELPTNPHLATLFGAVAENRSVRFHYRGRERDVVPGGLGFQGGHWYFSGWDRTVSDRRTYRLDRIAGSVEVGEVSEAEASSEAVFRPLRPWNFGVADRFTARIRVAPPALVGVVAQVGEDSIVTHDDDGWAQCAFEVTNRDGFRSWILEFGADVEVSEPDDVREEVIRWLQRATGELR